MTLTEARNNKRGFAGLRTKRTEIPVGTPWNCLHSSATNANFFTIRAQGLRSTYPNQLALQCETQFSFDRTGKFHMTFDPFSEIFSEMLLLQCHFSWQAQYLVRLEGETCCSAHCK